MYFICSYENALSCFHEHQWDGLVRGKLLISLYLFICVRKLLLFKTYWFVGRCLFTKLSVMCFHYKSWPTQVLHYLMWWNPNLSVFSPSSLQACITSKIPKIWNRRIYCPLYQVYSNVAKSLLLTTGLHLTLSKLTGLFKTHSFFFIKQ